MTLSLLGLTQDEVDMNTCQVSENLTGLVLRKSYLFDFSANVQQHCLHNDCAHNVAVHSAPDFTFTTFDGAAYFIKN
jgi:hypothetical protein